MEPETWVAIYAAIVGMSGLLLLKFKAWLDSGVKLRMTLIPDGVIRHDERDIIITISNRGDAPTMITNLVLLEMPTWWSRVRRRPVRSFIIPNPQLEGYPPNIPFDLAPAKSWTGVIRQRQDHIADLYTGAFYAGVYVSHRNKAYLKLIPKAKSPEAQHANTGADQ